jgi:predicted enzyme related to lactoylglutathione lyase
VLRLEHITFSCDDPARLAEFWGHLLDYETAGAGDSWLATDPRDEGAALLFSRMAKSPTIELPIHLDVNVPDREAELARVLELGGHLVMTKSHSAGQLDWEWTVMRDPEGNGFCIQSPPKAKPHRHIGDVTFACADPRKLGGSGRRPLAGPTRTSTRGSCSNSALPAWWSGT